MPGQIVHFEIPADDTATSREFWGSLFGWSFQSYPGPSEYHMTEITPGQTGGAITNMEPGKRGTRAYFDVDDIKAGAAPVKELGGHFTMMLVLGVPAELTPEALRAALDAAGLGLEALWVTEVEAGAAAPEPS